MKKLFILLTFFFTIGFIHAQYYDSCQGKYGAALKTQLYNIIKDHTIIDYGAIWAAFYYTDMKPDTTIWDMYSDIPGGTPPYSFIYLSNQCGNYSAEGDCYNREHSFPKSWFGDVPPMNSDLFHIYPTDGYVNNKRGNDPFGEVGTASWTAQNGSKVGTSNFPGYIGSVYEPVDGYKGDFARTYFYMVTRYENVVSTWTSDMINGTTYPAFTPWAIAMLLQWNAQDTVSEKEIARNEVIYNSYQHNRNPFIDHPEFATRIWGNDSLTANISNMQYETHFSVYPNPANDVVTITSSRDNKFQVEVLDVVGKEVMKSSGEFNLKLSVNQLSEGFYLVKCFYNKSQKIFPLIIKR
ncbi:MAG: endonuclease [Bacteroidota bacterium]